MCMSNLTSVTAINGIKCKLHIMWADIQKWIASNIDHMILGCNSYVNDIKDFKYRYQLSIIGNSRFSCMSNLTSVTKISDRKRNRATHKSEIIKSIKKILLFSCSFIRWNKTLVEVFRSTCASIKISSDWDHQFLTSLKRRYQLHSVPHIIWSIIPYYMVYHIEVWEVMLMKHVSHV